MEFLSQIIQYQDANHRGQVIQLWEEVFAYQAPHNDPALTIEKGRDLVNHSEQALAKLGCLKINLQIVASNQATTEFYERLGYQVEPRISMGKLLGNL